jgi:hypothetical protein
MRGELGEFLSHTLHLTLSMEKTKVTHLNEGFDFLGFHLQRTMGSTGMGVKTTISDKALRKHLDYFRKATSPSTYNDSLQTKIQAINRVIEGWSRYFQYTSKAATQFHKLDFQVFWLVAHWIAGKYRLSMPEVMHRYHNALYVALLKHASFSGLRYNERFFKPNPYVTQGDLDREELLVADPWTGCESRPGAADLRYLVLKRDGYRCCRCGVAVTPATCEVDHKRRYSKYKRPVDANRLENLQTLCIPCHDEKTKLDRQAESRMR